MMEERYFDPRRHSLPQSWDALDDARLSAVAMALHAPMATEMRTEALLKALLPSAGHWLIDAGDVPKALAFLDGPRRQRALAPVRLGMRMHHGPSDGMGNSSFGEFITAEAAFRQFAESGDARQLDRLCASLFRPSPWAGRAHGDPRAPFDSNAVDALADAWARVPMPRKLAVAAFFAGCTEGFAKAFPKLFAKAPQGHRHDRAVWLRAVHRLAGGLQNYGPVLESRARLVFFELSERIAEAERMRDETNARR